MTSLKGLLDRISSLGYHIERKHIPHEKKKRYICTHHNGMRINVYVQNSFKEKGIKYNKDRITHVYIGKMTKGQNYIPFAKAKRNELQNIEKYLNYFYYFKD